MRLRVCRLVGKRPAFRSTYGGHGREGFTLVELLTVIVIIGILAGILIPVVGTVRKKARSAQCLSNLRQCGAALLLHASENRGVINYKAGGSGGIGNIWTGFVANYVVSTAVNYSTMPRNPSLDILYCPSYFPFRHDPENSNWQWDCYGGYFVSTSSSKRTSVSEGGSTWTSHQINLATLDSPSRYPILMDSITPSLDRQRMNITSHTASSSAPSVHMRHGSRANTVFYDGHVKALDAVSLKDTGFVSGYDEDVKLVTF
ncbi:N-terminal cleavage protein [Opitutaceae bacterium TAV5]|nr:N-terminal cleavage protein [Opitutaceae bacterium TAV5]